MGLFRIVRTEGGQREVEMLPAEVAEGQEPPRQDGPSNPAMEEAHVDLQARSVGSRNENPAAPMVQPADDGARLRTWREARGVAQKELSALLRDAGFRCRVRTLQNWEAGRSPVPSGVWEALAGMEEGARP